MENIYAVNSCLWLSLATKQLMFHLHTLQGLYDNFQRHSQSDIFRGKRESVLVFC